jgi:hypothetical protein
VYGILWGILKLHYRTYGLFGWFGGGGKKKMNGKMMHKNGSSALIQTSDNQLLD